MNGAWLRPLILCLGAAIAASCSDGPAPPGAVTQPASASSASAPAPEVALDDFAMLPIRAVEAARKALAQAASAKVADSPPYLAFRRAVLSGEPFFRGRGFMAEGLLGGGPVDEVGGPLGKLDVAVAEGDLAQVAAQAAEVDRALLLLEDSFRRAPARRGLAVSVLPRAAYALGGVLAGSRPGLSQTTAGTIADAQGLLDAVEQTAAVYSKTAPPTGDSSAAAARVAERVRSLRAALDAAEKSGELSDRAALVVATGRLGADLRALLAPAIAWKPYVARVPHTGPLADDPISVLTVPALRRALGPRDAKEEERLAALGEKLFHDRGLSKGGARSCATCHVPGKGYADGKARPQSLDPEAPPLRHTPSLLYSALHAAQFWDGRALTSEKQAVLVMHSRAEMGGVEGVFPRHGLATASDAAAALAAFQERRLMPASSPLDRFARGEEQALSAEDRAGFDVFAGKGRCARCHVPPLFGGSHPNDFSTAVYSVLGVPESPAAKALDPDGGRGAVTRQPQDAGAFKTPTVRNVAATAPYFHNGAFPTLESVVDFYDEGGGRGLGLDVPLQDPDVRPLRLTEGEKRALLRFLRVALTDARGK